MRRSSSIHAKGGRSAAKTKAVMNYCTPNRYNNNRNPFPQAIPMASTSAESEKTLSGVSIGQYLIRRLCE